MAHIMIAAGYDQGSKPIDEHEPYKAMVNIGGRSLVTYPIEAALRTRGAEHVIVWGDEQRIWNEGIQMMQLGNDDKKRIYTYQHHNDLMFSLLNSMVSHIGDDTGCVFAGNGHKVKDLVSYLNTVKKIRPEIGQEQWIVTGCDNALAQPEELEYMIKKSDEDRRNNALWAFGKREDFVKYLKVAGLEMNESQYLDFNLNFCGTLKGDFRLSNSFLVTVDTILEMKLHLPLISIIYQSRYISLPEERKRLVNNIFRHVLSLVTHPAETANVMMRLPYAALTYLPVIKSYGLNKGLKEPKKTITYGIGAWNAPLHGLAPIKLIYDPYAFGMIDIDTSGCKDWMRQNIEALRQGAKDFAGDKAGIDEMIRWQESLDRFEPGMGKFADTYQNMTDSQNIGARAASK